MTNLAALAQAARENVSNVYEAQVIVGPPGVELLRKSTTLEVAPVEGERRAHRAVPPPGATQP